MQWMGLPLAVLAFPFCALNAQSLPPPAQVDLRASVQDVQSDYSETLVPVGWSQDGKFAYVQISAVFPPSPDPTFDYVILDTVEDRVVWSQRDESSGWPAVDRETEDPFAVSWKRQGSLFQEQWQKAGIIEGQGIQFLPFPLRAGGDRISCEVIQDDPSRAKIVVSSEKKGRKTVTSLSRPGPGEGISPAGCFVSPWEPRILVVLGLYQPVMDAASLLGYRFTGCLLTRGFSPR